MPWWGWLLTGFGGAIAWMAPAAVAGARIGARLARIREQEEQ